MTEELSLLLVAIFEEETAAERALDGLKQAQKTQLTTVQAAATVFRDVEGKLQIKETGDPGAPRGALAGALVGAVIGLLGGPAGAIVAGAAGALVGGFTARVIDSGIPDQNLELIGQSLMPGDSALVVIANDDGRTEVEALLSAAGARVLTGSLISVIAQQLELPPDAVVNDGPEAT